MKAKVKTNVDFVFRHKVSAKNFKWTSVFITGMFRGKNIRFDADLKTAWVQRDANMLTLIATNNFEGKSDEIKLRLIGGTFDGFTVNDDLTLAELMNELSDIQVLVKEPALQFCDYTEKLQDVVFSDGTGLTYVPFRINVPQKGGE